jgi:hypothetical protein
MREGARTLIVFGLALMIAAVLIHVVAAVLAVALPVGMVLIIAGVLWHLLSSKKS